jgi:hypothetical protein
MWLRVADVRREMHERHAAGSVQVQPERATPKQQGGGIIWRSALEMREAIWGACQRLRERPEFAKTHKPFSERRLTIELAVGRETLRSSARRFGVDVRAELVGEVANHAKRRPK